MGIGPNESEVAELVSEVALVRRVFVQRRRRRGWDEGLEQLEVALAWRVHAREQPIHDRQLVLGADA